MEKDLAAESSPFYIATWGALLQLHISANQHAKDSHQKHYILCCNRFNIKVMKDSSKRLYCSKKTRTRLQNLCGIASVTGPRVSIIHCTEVCIDPYDVCRPVVLTAFNYTSETGFILHIYFPESDSLSQLCNFCLKESISLNDVYVQLLDGPTIVLHFRKLVFVGFWDPQTKAFLTKQFSVSLTSPASIKHVWKTNKQEIFLLGVLSDFQETMQDTSMTDLFEDPSTEVMGSDWLILRATMDQIEAVNDISCLPHAYADVTVKVFALESHSNGVFGGGLILATRMAQLICIEGEKWYQVCDLPFTDVTFLSAVSIGDSNRVILVGSENKGICLVDLKTFQVHKHWPTSVSAFWEDFLSLGWNQILLISEQLSVDEEKQNSFILTDLIHTWTSEVEGGGNSNGKGQGEVCHEYLVNALCAVEIKLQNSSTLLQNLQLQSSQKNSVVQQSRTALQAISEQTGTLPQREPSLMCIMDPGDQAELPRNFALEQTYSSLVKTKSFWQRLVGRTWVIGTFVENEGTRPVSDICLLLVYTNHSGMNLTSISNVSYPSEGIGPMPGVQTASSLFLGPGEGTWVTSVSECPMFDDTPTITYEVALTWKEWIQNDYREQRVHQSIERRKCFMKSSLSFKDLEGLAVNVVLDKICSGKMTKVDFLALDSVQEYTRLTISSQHSAVHHVPHLLCSEMRFTQVKMNGDDGFSCDKGQLSGMRIFSENVNATSLRMDVYSWNKRQLILFCRALYSVLPFDVSVMAVDSGSNARTKATTDLILHLQSELDMIKEAMSGDSEKDVPANTASRGLGLKDFLNVREKTDKAVRRLSSVSGT